MEKTKERNQRVVEIQKKKEQMDALEKENYDKATEERLEKAEERRTQLIEESKTKASAEVIKVKPPVCPYFRLLNTCLVDSIHFQQWSAT